MGNGRRNALKPEITITFCTRCNWHLRSGWMAQELFATFGDDIGAVRLAPGEGGQFSIAVDGTIIWDRKADGGFPEAKVLKQRVRDHAWPGADLGHADRPAGD
jgi:selenoprotein W-related protein